MSYEPDMLSVLETLQTNRGRATISWVPDRTVFLTKSGSQAYGTSTPTSDTDYKGICVEPPHYYKGFAIQFEQADFSKPDAVIFSLRKFIKLATECNPNIVEMLYTDPEDWLIGEEVERKSDSATSWFETTIFGQLIERRDWFLSTKAKHTFSGYAMSQLKRIRGHHTWFTNPPAKEPTREQFGLPPITLCPMDQLLAAEAAIRKHVEALFNLEYDLPPAETIAVQEKLEALKTRVTEVVGTSGLTLQAAVGKSIGFDENFLELLDKERAHKAARTNWENYQRWKRERNPARAQLEAKYGYDTKHAMHLVRLLRMGREILQGKGVLVRRPDAEELLDIRNGSLTYDELVEYAERESAAMAADVETSRLPHAPDRYAIDKLCVDLYDEYEQNHPTLED